MVSRAQPPQPRSHRESILLFGAKTALFHEAPADLATPAAVYEKGVLVTPKATAEDVAVALWLYLKGVTGFRGNGVRMVQLFEPIAQRRLRVFARRPRRPARGGSR